MKVFRPLWSYRIEQTESWLAEKASDGQRLVAMNRWTRMFTFEQQQPAQRVYRLNRNKKTTLGLSRLEEKGWTADVQEKEWTILSAENPTLYPVRDELLQRTQRHLYVWIFLVWMHLVTTSPIFIAGMVVGESMFNWLPFTILFTDTALLIGFFYLIRKHLNFQKREMGMGADAIRGQKKHYRIYLGWFYDLPQLEKRLERKACEGLILSKVYSVIFVFVEQEPELRSYQCMFEYKVKSSYFSTFKEMGWHLHFSTKVSFMHYAIWSMAYDHEEEKPLISYVNEERLRNLKRAYRFHLGISVYLILLMVLNLTLNRAIDVPWFELSFMSILQVLLFLFLILWTWQTWKITKGYFVQKNQLLAD